MKQICAQFGGKAELRMAKAKAVSLVGKLEVEKVGGMGWAGLKWKVFYERLTHHEQDFVFSLMANQGSQKSREVRKLSVTRRQGWA